MEIEQVIENSYRDLHVKGFDYVCLKLTPEHTRKVYFFDGKVSQLPEVVSPHDHRYDFTTTVLAGVMSNSTYREAKGCEDDIGTTYNEFEWRTPLNGGDGFTFKKETELFETQRFQYANGEVYFMRAEQFHTIRMKQEGTVIMLDQFADRVPVGQPTRTFMLDRKAPDMSGLYNKFTPDQLLYRLRQIEALGVSTGIALS
ncbi:hypothetical protein [Mesorhizobium sp.]|uniref:hypothetical protein n=1 Tax=Mesorhizobium sp. TaxID=1871066 RepID=UPI000FE9A033|nr:hypothetical protein [Mesorhizobium sp.]RWM84336.1 MAG: hypothetical protein EOR83_17090 [Mesorhizobium sp.]